jgi:hypothetical protein
MPFTVTHPLGKRPTFPELLDLASQHKVQINGNEATGDFCHPEPEHPKVKGTYIFEHNGDIHGEFTSHVLGKLTGKFTLATGQAGVTINEKPFLLPEAVLKSRLAAALKEFSGKFPSGA